MADAVIQLPADGAGKKLDAESLTVGANTVHRERHQVVGAADDDIAVVTDTTPGGSDHGLVTRPAALPLPTGAATETTLAAIDAGKLEEATFTGRVGEVQASPTANTILGRLKDIDDAVSGTVTVDGSGVTQPISASSLPLPSGAATAANQSTEITSLQKLDNIAHSGQDVALVEHVPISGQLDDTATASVTENQIAPVRITSDRALHVAQQGTATVSGTVTANAGTNLNTSALALEAGNLATIAGAVSGAEMQVDVVGALPAGTNAIGKLAVNDGVDIGDVDVTSHPADTFVAEAGSLGKGVLLQGDDGTDRKNVNVDPTTGDLQVDVTNTVSVDATGAGDVPITLGGEKVAVSDIEDGAGTSVMDAVNNAIQVNVVAGGAAGGTSAADDADFVAGTTAGTPSMGVYESSPTSVTDGDLGTIGITQTREVKVSIENDSVGIGGGTQYTEDAAAAADPTGNMLMAVRDDALSAQTDTDGDNIALRATNNGELYIKHVDDLVVSDIEDGAGTSVMDAVNNAIQVNVVAGGAAGGTSAADDADFTAGTTAGTPAMGVYESSPTSVTDGDLGTLGITQTRELKVSIENDSVGIGGGTQYTEDDAAAANPVGNMLMAVRDDALSGQTTTDGDNIALRATDNGEVYVKHVDSIPATQSGTWNITNVSGTVSLPTGAATAANQLPDGHNVTVDNAAGASAVNIQDGGNVITVDGTVNAAQSGTWNVTNISGTVSLPTGAATAANQTTEITSLQKLDNIAHSGQDVALVEHVPISGQFDDTATNTVTEDQIAPIRITSGRAMHVAQQGTVTVSGTITADAGTNLNTSALALETGGNLAAATTALQIIDDWDETNRCAVNPISGQAGVSGGSGTVDATTQRVTLATDVALPAGTNAIGKLAANDGVDIGNVDVASISENTNHVGKTIPGDYELAGNTNHVKKYYTNAGAVTDGIVWSPAAGKRWYITDIFINVSAAATVTLEDDLTAGDDAVWKAELAANSGWSHSFKTPLFSGEDAADLLVTTTAGNVYITVTGYEV